MPMKARVTKTICSHLLQQILVASTQTQEQGKTREIPMCGFHCMTSSWMKSITAFALVVLLKLFSPCIFNKNQTPNSEQMSMI